jgi:hypothetical protein
MDAAEDVLAVEGMLYLWLQYCVANSEERSSA